MFARRLQRIRIMFSRCRYGFVTGCLLLMSGHAAAALSPDAIPPDLKPWVNWVLADTPEHRCPFLYNNDQRHCTWPSRLQLNITQDQGRFEQAWHSYREAWLTLPGDRKTWPSQVMVNGQAVAVSDQNGTPAVLLPAGEYQLSGRFDWHSPPKTIGLPADIGLIDLTLHGQPVAFPRINNDSHTLWIDKPPTDNDEKGLQDRLTVQTFRKLLDQLPLQVETQLRLQVSGSQREVLIDHPLLADSIPLSVRSPLPARLEPDGRLRVQVRPGEWQLSVTGRFPGPVTALSAPADIAEPEVWSFEAVNALRLVEVTGAIPLDPRQTRMPTHWQSLPAYRLLPGETLTLTERRRGDPTPEPNQLQITREAWLDFSGDGYTVRDKISGSMTNGWRLTAQPALQLGRITLDGQPQLITTLETDDTQGVEVRRGRINLQSIARLQGPVDHLDAAGWLSDFSRAEFILNLPPGWRLLSASGMDNVPDTWLQRWTLLDIFLVLIISLAVGKLWGLQWAPLALVTLALLWHEPEAPRFVWLNIVAAVALLRVIPAQSKAFRFVEGYRLASLLALLIISLPFMVQQVRTGLYPQLERPYQAAVDTVGSYRTRGVEALESDMLLSSPTVSSSKVMLDAARKPVPETITPAIAAFDPNALVQTGPGAPRWSWHQVHFGWNGPLQQGQQIDLVFVTPTQNLLLNLLRVALLLALAARLVGRLEISRFNPQPAHGAAALLLLTVGLFPADPAYAEPPSPGLLAELKQRFLEPPACTPHCADINQLFLNADTEQLHLRLTLHAQATVSVPLPGQAAHWLPDAVQINDKPAQLQRDAQGVLWVLVSPGVHQLDLRGRLPQRSTLQIPLTLQPHNVSAKLQGWTLDGVDEQGNPARQLQLTRVQASTTNKPSDEALKPSELPPFVQVQRILHLGLDWTIETRVQRQSPMGTAAVLRVPLIAGESVTTEDVQVIDGYVLVNLAADREQASWRSTLKPGDIHLTAAQQNEWVEQWQLDISPIWHVSSSGIPVVHHTDTDQQWLPEWRPWPGESITLQVTRPAGVAGPTLTLEATRLQVNPGLRATDATLQLSLLASQGGQHTIQLPADAKLQSVTIDGEAQAIRQQGRAVSLPIEPGEHQVQLNWQTPTPIETRFETPEIDLGMPAANASLHLSLSSDRWILLLGGPTMGPAILWWGVLAVIIIVAIALGRLPISPLRSHQWVLLGLGLSQTFLFVPLIIAGWLLALGWRGRMSDTLKAERFNTVQLLLAIWTVIALLLLFGTIQQGLLGQPDMMVLGNQSSANQLQWYQDRTDGLYPQAWVISVPMLAYRLAMLAWALWLAFSLLKWLQWGWRNYAQGGLWRKIAKASDKTNTDAWQTTEKAAEKTPPKDT